MATDPWKMLPRAGLGGLTFGLSLAEASEHVAPYGALVADDVLDPFAGDDTYRHLVDSLGEAAAREAMAAIAEAGVDTRPRHLLEFEAGVTLSLVDDELEDIMWDRRAVAGHVEGHPLFGADPMPALRALQAANGAPPLIRGPDCLFANLFVTAFEVVILRENGTVRPTNEATDEAQQKTISWRQTPRDATEDLSRHRPVDLTLS